MGTINSAQDAITENIKISTKDSIGHCEAKHHKSWLDEECSNLVDRRKQAKLQWLQDPSVVKEDNLSNVRREASRQFRNNSYLRMGKAVCSELGVVILVSIKTPVVTFRL
jgi:hypothetical protein